MLPNGASSSRARNGSLPTLPLVPGNGRPAVRSEADLAVAYHHPFVGCYLTEPDGTTGHRLLRRIDNLRSQAELGAVGKLSRCIPISHGRIHFVDEAAAGARVVGDNRVGVSRPVARYVVEGLIERIDNPYSRYRRQKLPPEVIGRGRLGARG